MLFKLLNEPLWRSETASFNKEQRMLTAERRDAEKAEAMVGKEHLADVVPESASKAIEKKIHYPAVDWTKAASAA